MLAALLAATAAAGLAGVIAWCGPVDRPEGRRRHRWATPTAGGLALIVATVVGLAALPAGPASADLARLLALAGALGLFGAADDVWDFPATVKLAVQLALALAFALWVARIEVLPLAPALKLGLWPPLAVGLTAAWLVVMINAVNFMDGADGLAPGACVLTLAGLALAAAAAGGDAGLAAVCGVAAVAGLGLLGWNFPRARLFQGDAGAQFSGFLIGGLAVLFSARGLTTPYFVPIAAAPLLIDVLLTLWDRTRRGRPLLTAHREHLYQLWLDQPGRSHAALAWRFWALSALAVLLALQIERTPEGWRLALALTAAALGALFWAWARRPLGEDSRPVD